MDGKNIRAETGTALTITDSTCCQQAVQARANIITYTIKAKRPFSGHPIEEMILSPKLLRSTTGLQKYPIAELRWINFFLFVA